MESYSFEELDHALDNPELFEFETAPEATESFRGAVSAISEFNLSNAKPTGLSERIDLDELLDSLIQRTRQLTAQEEPALSISGIGLITEIEPRDNYPFAWAKIKFRLEDGSSFVSFLKGIKPENTDHALRSSVQRVTEDIYKGTCYDIRGVKPDLQVYEAAVSAGSIAESLSVIGMADYDITNRLAGLKQAFAGEYAKEYALAEILGLLSREGSVDSIALQPSYAATADRLGENWREVFRLIDILGERPSADKFRSRLIERARLHLSYIKHQWQENQSLLRDKLGENYGQTVEEIIGRANNELYKI